MNNNKRFRTQVRTGYYLTKEYDHLERFIQYSYQVELVRKYQKKKRGRILEIGVGNKFLSSYLKKRGFNITTCDFDSSLKPDYISDIRKLPFKRNSFDLVVAFEILEHIPYKDFEIALQSLHKVTKNYVIISVPYAVANFEIILKLPYFGKFFNKPYIDIFIKIPYFFERPRFQ